MLFKLIVFGAIFYGIYRLLGGKILPDNKSKKIEDDDIDDDTLVECETCSTYVVKKEALFYKGKYYCSKECLPVKK